MQPVPATCVLPANSTYGQSATRKLPQKLCKALLVNAWLCSMATAYPILITNHTVTAAYASDTDAGYSTEQNNSLVLPNSGTLTAVVGMSSSTTTYDWTGNANTAVFSLTSSHAIDSTTGNISCCEYAASYTNTLYFTALADSTYTFDGYYSANNPAGTQVLNFLYLYDETTFEEKFWDYSASYYTADEYFEVGETGDADTYNFNSGSSSGLLTAGHNYHFYYGNQIMAIDPNNNPTRVTANAEGNLRLTINSLASVPEPGTLIIMGLSLLGLMAARKMQNSG